MLIWWLLVCVSTVYQDTAVVAKNLEDALTVKYKWKYLDFEYACEKDRQKAIKSGEYNRSNINPIDLDYWHGTIFVTTVRDVGVPSSLNTISEENGPGGPLLAPYPDWSWTRTDTCSGIISTYRVAIDKCDRLWVLDTGVFGTTRICPAKLVVFDLHTTTVLKRITIPKEIAINSTTGRGLLVTPEVYTSGPDCETTQVYIADARGNALIMYNGRSFRRVTSGVFDYDPAGLTFTVLGQNFTLPDGPVGMALSPMTQNLYFSPMASFNFVYVDSWELRNRPNDQIQYRQYRNILTTQATAKAMSKRGTLFYGLTSSTAIGCWSEYNELSRENMDLVAQNNVTLQVPGGLKIIRSASGQEVLIVVSNRYQRYATKTMDFTDYNYRILFGNVENLVRGTRCEPPRYSEISE